MMLTKEQILGANDLRVEKVDVPEWGGSVYVRVMSASQRDRFEVRMKELNEKKNLANLRGFFVSLVLCDEQGNRLFTDDDATALGEKSSAPVQRVFQVGCDLNALGKDQIEELEKNS